MAQSCDKCFHHNICVLWSTSDLVEDEAHKYCFDNFIDVADVVKVVRCKDCKYCEERHYEENGEMPYIKLTCKWSNYSHLPNDFCSLGERKESGNQ